MTMELNTKDPAQGVIDAAKQVDNLAWGFDDPVTVERDDEVTIAAGALLDLHPGA